MKLTEIWDSGILVTHIHVWCTLNSVLFNVIWGHLMCTCLTLSWNSKRAGRTAKRTEIRDSEKLVTHIVHVIGSVQYHLGVIRCTCLKGVYSLTPASRRASVVEIWGSKTLVQQIILGTLVPQMSVHRAQMYIVPFLMFLTKVILAFKFQN